MKNQALFSSKDKSEKLKCRLLQFLFGALRVKFPIKPQLVAKVPLTLEEIFSSKHRIATHLPLQHTLTFP